MTERTQGGKGVLEKQTSRAALHSEKVIRINGGCTNLPSGRRIERLRKQDGGRKKKKGEIRSRVARLPYTPLGNSS